MWKHGKSLRAYLIGLTFAMPAHAELGGSPAFAINDFLHSTTVETYRTASSIPYTLYVTTLDTGVTIKEYASKSGNVFAVVWIEPKSQIAPIALLLGAYLPCYQQALDEAVSQSGPLASALSIEQSGLSIRVAHEVERNSGRVYLRQALPVGFEERVIN